MALKLLKYGDKHLYNASTDTQHITQLDEYRDGDGDGFGFAEPSAQEGGMGGRGELRKPSRGSSTT